MSATDVTTTATTKYAIKRQQLRTSVTAAHFKVSLLHTVKSSRSIITVYRRFTQSVFNPSTTYIATYPTVLYRIRIVRKNLTLITFSVNSQYQYFLIERIVI